MSINDDTKVRAVSSTVDTLRGELKAWEKAFAKANEGRKAGRDDIKKDPDIGMLHWSDRIFGHRPNPRQSRNTKTTPSFVHVFPPRTFPLPRPHPLPHYPKSAKYLLLKTSPRALSSRHRSIPQPSISTNPPELSVLSSPLPITAPLSDPPLRRTEKSSDFSISSPRSPLRSIKPRPSGYLY